MFPELSPLLGQVYFWLFAVIAVACAVNLLLSRHPLIGVVSLIGVMLCLSGLYAILHSPFIAVLQVLVYAGAIMMLLVFVIMILNQGKDHQVPGFDRSAIIGILVPVALAWVVCRELPSAAALSQAAPERGGMHELAARMFATGGPGFDTGAIGQGWWLLFEVGGLVLLAAVVGAVLLAKRHLETDADKADKADEPARLSADEVEAHDPHGAH
ncbi:MAG TPA: NADH-quinone oxidoreductase subunit J [Planctomycetota bacterium]|nr:NADH-quinone oxidoreductase subunit J [Planctomycetota bacterium]